MVSGERESGLGVVCGVSAAALYLFSLSFCVLPNLRPPIFNTSLNRFWSHRLGCSMHSACLCARGGGVVEGSVRTGVRVCACVAFACCLAVLCAADAPTCQCSIACSTSCRIYIYPIFHALATARSGVSNNSSLLPVVLIRWSEVTNICASGWVFMMKGVGSRVINASASVSTGSAPARSNAIISSVLRRPSCRKFLVPHP